MCWFSTFCLWKVKTLSLMFYVMVLFLQSCVTIVICVYHVLGYASLSRKACVTFFYPAIVFCLNKLCYVNRTCVMTSYTHYKPVLCNLSFIPSFITHYEYSHCLGKYVSSLEMFLRALANTNLGVFQSLALNSIRFCVQRHTVPVFTDKSPQMQVPRDIFA